MKSAQNNLNKKIKIEKLIKPAEIKNINLSEISPDVKMKESFNYTESIVSYVDILGFSGKKDLDDIETTLFDFSSPLAIASRNAPNVKFYIFSDCAFIVSHIDFAGELLASIRYAFTQWISDGILVRAGIAKGSFGEIFTWIHSKNKKYYGKNFIASLFSGNAVVEAVRLEENGDAALLFCSEDCAQFYHSHFNEKILTIENDKMILPWTKEDKALIRLAAITSRRLVKFLSCNDEKYDSIIKKLKKTIVYSIKSAEKAILPFSIVVTVLDLPDTPETVRNAMYEFLSIDDINDYKVLIQNWQETDYYKIMKFIADSDSSIP